MPTKNDVVIFTDGASKGNPGPGGWGAIISFSSADIREIGGYCDQTTNNRMELSAVIESLACLDDVVPRSKIILYSDSKYVLDGTTKWVHGWIRKGWLTAAGKQVLNRDLWEALEEQKEKLSKRQLFVDWRHVPGHAGFIGNERADAIASAYALMEPVELYTGLSSQYPHDILASLPEGTNLSSAQKHRTDKSAVVYLSLIDGELQQHTTWLQCKRTVKGRKGAKFKKAKNKDEIKQILVSWGVSGGEI